MTAKAVAMMTSKSGGDATSDQPKTLRLPVKIKPSLKRPAEVTIFDEARADLPRPHITTDQQAEEALHRHRCAIERERKSRERGGEILRRRREGDRADDDGNAMLARPYRNVPIAFLSTETLEAALTRQFVDSHLIDRMWDAGQLNDWQYATANRLLQLCEETGMLSSKVALLGRAGGSGWGEMSDGMAAAWKEWGRCMDLVGQPASEILSEICQGNLTIRGQSIRSDALENGLRRLARRWGIDMT